MVGHSEPRRLTCYGPRSHDKTTRRYGLAPAHTPYLGHAAVDGVYLINMRVFDRPSCLRKDLDERRAVRDLCTVILLGVGCAVLGHRFTRRAKTGTNSRWYA